jgi:putative transposase
MRGETFPAAVRYGGMPRPPRLELPGVPQHVRQRGNNGAACFFNDADRRFYLKCLTDAAARRGCAIHAYALMTNHVHLLVTPSVAGAIAMMMQDLSRYVRVINVIHRRTGSLWEARYRSSLVASESYLLNCHRYIELNPVRAGLVSDAASYRWSSHLHYAGVQRDGMITEHFVYAGLAADPADRQAAYRLVFATQLEEQLIAKIREAINTDSGFGSETFLDEMQTRLGRSVRPPARGRPPKKVTEKSL